MARRRSRKAAKIEPAVKTLTFELGRAPGPAFNDPVLETIDLGQVCSIVNRRFYRQGLNWAVAGFTVFTSGEGVIGIHKIPDTWIASNAWEKGMRTWLKMNREALDEVESVRPKFLDFKVFMDHNHHSDGVGANLIPMDTLGNSFTVGEWEYSKMVIPDTTDGAVGGIENREIIWTGANYPGAGASGLGAVSLIEGYAASRGLPDIRDPNAPIDAASIDGPNPENWMSATFNEGTQQIDEVVGDMVSENNLAPYPFENDGIHGDTQYPGGANQAPGLEIHDNALVTATSIGGKTMISGTNFQGGLIRVMNIGTDEGGWDTPPILLVHLVPGPHRGYMCQPQKDV